MARQLRVLVALAMALSGVAAAVGGSATPVRAGSVPWAITLTPGVLQEDEATSVEVRVMPGDKDIGCIAIDIPAGFDVVDASVTSVPAGAVWSHSVVGSGPTLVVFCTTKDSWRLKDDRIGVFRIRVIAKRSPLGAWEASAYEKFTLDPDKLIVGPLLPPAPFVILPAPTPTPVPTPKPTPTPVPTPKPTPTPVPTPKPTPTPVPTPKPTPTPVPTPKPTPTPVPTPTPTDEVTPAPTPRPDSTAAAPADPSSSPSPALVSASPPTASSSEPPSQAPVVGSPASPRPGGGGFARSDAQGLDVGALPGDGTVNLDDIQAVGAIGMFAWLVPGLFLSLPGLLVILIVALQAGVASAFVPITRRVLGGRRRRTAS